MLRLSALKGLCTALGNCSRQSAVMCTGPEMRLPWKLQRMLGTDEIRNMLQAVVWVYFSAEVRDKMVKQYCTGCVWLFDTSNQLVSLMRRD